MPEEGLALHAVDDEDAAVQVGVQLHMCGEAGAAHADETGRTHRGAHVCRPVKGEEALHLMLTRREDDGVVVHDADGTVHAGVEVRAEALGPDQELTAADRVAHGDHGDTDPADALLTQQSILFYHSVPS